MEEKKKEPGRRKTSTGGVVFSGKGMRAGYRWIQFGIDEHIADMWREGYGSYAKGAMGCTRELEVIRMEAERNVGMIFTAGDWEKMSRALSGEEVRDPYSSERLYRLLAYLRDGELESKVRMLGVAETEAVYRRCGCKIV